MKDINLSLQETAVESSQKGFELKTLKAANINEIMEKT